jgi:hypothetical protein
VLNSYSVLAVDMLSTLCATENNISGRMMGLGIYPVITRAIGVKRQATGEG